MEHAKNHPESDILIIDNVNIKWLLLVLKKLGFTGTFTDFITTLYKASTARFVTHDTMSDRF